VEIFSKRALCGYARAQLCKGAVNIYEQTTDEIGTVRVKSKKSAGRVIVTIILILLILPVVLAGLLYLYINVADFRYDDPEQVISSSVPMSFSKRNSFDAASMTQTMLFDNADLYFLTRDVMPDLHLTESVYINAYRFALEDSAVYIQGKAYGLNVPVRLDVDLRWENGSPVISVKGASLGSLQIPLPVGTLAEKFDISLEYPFSLDEIPLLQKATGMRIEDGFMKVGLPVDNDVVAEGLDAWTYIKPALIYMNEENEMGRLLESYRNNWMNKEYVSEELKEYVKKFQNDPEEYQRLKVQILAASPVKAADEFFSAASRSEDIMSRFYPGITREAVEQLRKEVPYEQYYNFLKNYVSDIDEKFGSETIVIKNGSFVYKKSGEALDMRSLYADVPGADVIFSEGTEYCAVLCTGADSKQKIGRLYYSSCTAFRFSNGRCMVVCQVDRKLYYNEITPEEYEDLKSGKTTAYLVAIVDR
jgi:uncharacterized protein YpmS